MKSLTTAIRLKCLSCKEDNILEIVNCPDTKCPLHEFRQKTYRMSKKIQEFTTPIEKSEGEDLKSNLEEFNNR